MSTPKKKTPKKRLNKMIHEATATPKKPDSLDKYPLHYETFSEFMDKPVWPEEEQPDEL